MKILNVSQIRNTDAMTIRNQGISSWDLMERAAQACFQAIVKQFSDSNPEFIIFCGTGNNGGDGLAIARMLLASGRKVRVIIAGNPDNGSDDFRINLAKLKQMDVNPEVFSNAEIQIDHQSIVIDALFGTGLNRPLSDDYSPLINAINHSGAVILSIDIPSGLFCDSIEVNEPVVQATQTLTFQFPKLSFLFPESGVFTGEFTILDIGLDLNYYRQLESDYQFVDEDFVKSNFTFRRNKFSHKGHFGHGLLCAGKYGMAGAAILSAGAALRGGLGLLTVQTPQKCVDPIQISVPEAMVMADASPNHLNKVGDWGKYDAIGIGPGIGTSAETATFLEEALQKVQCPMVLDADALNLLASHTDLKNYLGDKVVITPHPGEFDRLFGASRNSWERLQLAKEMAHHHQITIVLKGAHTAVIGSNQKVFFNSTGNPGMAKAGSGDVLTGIILAQLAQGKEPLQAAVLGVYIHGLAGDFAAQSFSQNAMKAGDIIQGLKEAFRTFEGK